MPLHTHQSLHNIENLGRAVLELKVNPEIEIFDIGMIYTAQHYIKTGILKPPCHFQLILGAAGYCLAFSPANNTCNKNSKQPSLLGPTAS